MRVAIVHDWLTGLRGGERCLAAFLKLYPEADIFTLLHVPGSTTPEIDRRVKATSFIQRLPDARRFYRLLLPLYPRAIRSFNLEGYDLIISLSHAAAKNVRVPRGALHLCYCFTPMRYIWDQVEVYFGWLTPIIWPLIRALRSWDTRGSRSVDHFTAISEFVAARIRFFYRRSAEVMYPPVDTSWIVPAAPGERGEAFLYAGALVPYKRPELVVEAFNRLGEPLWIVGSGPEEQRLRRMARSNITFLGRAPDEELAGYYRRCRALVFPGVEDFGLIPVECLAAGRPVVGLCDGALRETLTGVRPWAGSPVDPRVHTGVFVQKSRPGGELESLLSSLRFFLDHEAEFDPATCVRRAREFSPERFFAAWRTLVAGARSVGDPVRAGRAKRAVEVPA